MKSVENGAKPRRSWTKVCMLTWKVLRASTKVYTSAAAQPHRIDYSSCHGLRQKCTLLIAMRRTPAGVRMCACVHHHPYPPPTIGTQYGMAPRRAPNTTSHLRFPDIQPHLSQTLEDLELAQRRGQSLHQNLSPCTEGKDVISVERRTAYSPFSSIHLLL